MTKKKFDKDEYFKKVVKKENEETVGNAIAIIIIIIVFVTIAGFISDFIIDFVKGLFSSEAKDFCATSAEVRMAKTDYAAKQAFKECMRNY